MRETSFQRDCKSNNIQTTLPNFIKSRKDYRMGRIEDGLVEAFVEFDRSLIERDIVRELRVIAGKEAAGEEEQVDAEEVARLSSSTSCCIPGK